MDSSRTLYLQIDRGRPGMPGIVDQFDSNTVLPWRNLCLREIHPACRYIRPDTVCQVDFRLGKERHCHTVRIDVCAIVRRESDA